MNLDEFKEKYPAYKNIDDDELAGALYNKFYKDKVSHSDFREKIGLSPEVMSSEPEQGILGKAKDFAGAIKDTVTGKSEPGVGLVSKQDFEAFKPDSPLKIPEIQLPGREQKKPDKARYGTGLVPDLEGKGERVESKEKTPDSEGFVHHELMGAPSWRQAESPSAFKKAINRIKDSFRISPEKSANVVALAQENGIPPHIVLEHYDELTEGLRTQPKPMELYSGLITYPIIMGLMTNPTGVIAGLSSFMAIDEIENLAVSKIKNEKYHPLGGKGLVDLAPSQLNDNAKTAIEILDFIGKGALAGKIGQVADRTVSNWWKNLSSRERGLQTLKINERVKQGDMSLGQALRERARQAKQEGRYEEQMEQFINEYVRSKRKTKARPETKTEPKPAPEPGVKPSEEVSKPGEIKILEKTQELTKPTEAPESTGRPITPSETIEPQFEQTVRAQPGKQPISGPVRQELKERGAVSEQPKGLSGPEKPVEQPGAKPKEPWEMSLEEFRREAPNPRIEAEENYLSELESLASQFDFFGTIGRGAPGVREWIEKKRTQKSQYDKTGRRKVQKTGTQDLQELLKNNPDASRPAKQFLKTALEYFKQNRKDFGLTVDDFPVKKHKKIIQQALSEGKPVPEEVLAEYPDLKPEKPAEKPETADEFVEYTHARWDEAKETHKRNLKKELNEKRRAITTNRTGVQSVLTKDMTGEAKWRVTFLTPDNQPAGHENYNNLDKALDSMDWSVDEVRPDIPDDYLTSDPKDYEHVYESTLRPVGPGAVPKDGLVRTEGKIDPESRKFGRAVYDHVLTQKELDHFDLKPVGFERVSGDAKQRAPKTAPKEGKVEVESTATGETTVSAEIPEQKAEALSPKEQKRYFEKELDTAIENAVEAAKEEAESPSAAKNIHGTVTIEVPGDGEFTIINTKQHLREMKSRLKRWPEKAEAAKTPGHKKPPIPQRITKSKEAPGPYEREGRVIDVEYYNEFKPREQGKIIEGDKRLVWKDGFYSNSDYMIKLPEKPSLTKKGAERLYTGDNAPPLAEKIKELNEKAKPANLMGETVGPQTDFGVAHVHATSEIGDFLYNAKYIDNILTKHPKAKPYMNDTGVLIFRDNKKLVGGVGPQEGGMSPSPLQVKRIEEIHGKESLPSTPVRERPVFAEKGGSDAFIPQYQEIPPGGVESQSSVQDHILNIDMPELVRLSKEILEGKYPKIKRGLSKKGALGAAKFRGPTANIDLRYDIYKSPTLAKKVLAHEIGHVIDWLPDKETRRGNILGRIASLKRYMKSTIDSMPAEPSQVLSEVDRRKIRNQAQKEAKAEGAKDDELKKLTKEKYQQRIIDEIHARDLYTKQEIMEELKGLTQKWNPFDPTVDSNYTKYRHSSKELYAEAVSVLLNDPQLLKFEAPKFWDSFWNYAERKPEVIEIYNQIQDELSGVTSQGVHFRSRQDLRDGFRKYDRYFSQQAEKMPLRARIAEEFLDVSSAVIKRAKRVNERNIPPEKNPRYKIDQLRHSGSEFELYMSDAMEAKKTLDQAGLTLSDLGEYATHLRIIHERVRYSKEDEQFVEIANPAGFDKKSSQAVLDEWKEALGPEKWEALEQARQQFYKNHKRVVEKMRDSEVFSDELMDKIEDAEYYATFAVGKYMEQKYGKGVGTAIYRQYGTHQLTANPITATMVKDLALIKSVNRHIAARTVTDFLQEYYPQDIKTPEKKYDANKGYAVPVEPTTSGLEQIKYLHKGKLETYDVPKEIADSVEMNPVESNLITEILRVSGKPFRHLFVEANPGFWLFNTMRDTMRPAKNIPTLTLFKFIPQYTKALKPSFKSAFGVPDRVIRQMQKGNMLISLENFRGWEASEDAVLEKQLKQWHASPEKWYQQVIKPITTAYTYWTNIGKALERAPKVATYQYLKKKFPDLSDEVVGHIVRNHGGSPDFLRKGGAYNLYNNLFFFSSAIKEGWRSDIEAGRGQLAEKLNLKKSKKQAAAGWWWKHAKYTLIPKALMYAASLGLLGEGVRRIMDGASEYDKSNYLVVPIGITPNGKSVYFRFPTDETGRMVGGIFWKALEDNKGNDIQNLFDYMVGQAPTLHPVIGVATDTVQYASGKNPYDFFHGRHAIPRQLFEAHDWETHEAFAKYIANKSGLSVIHRFRHDDLERVKSELEEIVDYPISSNTIGRFLKVTDYGIRQDIEKTLDEEKTEHARELKDARNAIIKLLNGESLTRNEMVAMIKHPQSVDRNFSVLLARKYGSVWQNALLSAQTNREKALILREFLKKHPELMKNKKATGEKD